MDKYDLLAIVAPIAAPAAPATLLVNILYTDMLREAVNANFALLSAVLSGIGAEASGMIAAYVGVQAFRKRKYPLMFVAICAFIVYALFMAAGISVTKNPVTMVSTIVISIIAYLATAALSDLRGEGAEKVNETRLSIEQMEAQTDLEKARASRERAIARQGVQRPTGQTGQTGQPAKIAPESAKVTAIKAYWVANPGASLRDCAEACECSPTTAGKWKP